MPILPMLRAPQPLACFADPANAPDGSQHGWPLSPGSTYGILNPNTSPPLPGSPPLLTLSFPIRWGKSRGLISFFERVRNPFAALPLSLLLDASQGVYNPATGIWTPTPSAGTSAANAAAAALATAPTRGAGLNGLPTVAFHDVAAQALVTAALTSAIVTAAAWSAFALVKPVVGAAAPHFLFSGTGDLVNAQSDNPQTTAVADQTAVGGVKTATITPLTAPPAWQFWQFRFDGANIQARLNSGAWQLTASGNILGALNTPMAIGSNAAGGQAFNGEMATIGMAQVSFSDAQFNAIKASLNSRWGLAL